MRSKGVLAVAGRARKLIFHSVHMQFDGALGSEWASGERRMCRLVFIGTAGFEPGLGVGVGEGVGVGLGLG